MAKRANISPLARTREDVWPSQMYPRVPEGGGYSGHGGAMRSAVAAGTVVYPGSLAQQCLGGCTAPSG